MSSRLVPNSLCIQRYIQHYQLLAELGVVEVCDDGAHSRREVAVQVRLGWECEQHA